MKRRDFVAISASAPLVHAAKAPTAPVAIEKCADYGAPLVDTMDRRFDKLGGLGFVRPGVLIAGTNPAAGIGLADLASIEVAGAPIAAVRFPFPAV